MKSHLLYDLFHGEAGGDQRCLCILRQIKLVIFFKTECFHVQIQPLTGRIKNLFCSIIFLIKIFSHPGFLCALSWKDECCFSHLFIPPQENCFF